MITVRAAFRVMVIGLPSIFITVMTELGSDLWECFLHRLRLTCSLAYIKLGFSIWWVTLVSSGSAANQ